MYTTAANMDFEKCQDLSGLAWFEEAACWPAGEMKSDNTSTMTFDAFGETPLINMAPYEDIEYNNIRDIDTKQSSYYNLSRTDSLEEIKFLPVAAPMEVVPMQFREAMEVQNIVKIEKHEFDVGREEEVVGKETTNLFKVEPDELDLALDSQELLQELGDGDLINYIISDPPELSPPPPPEIVKTPAHPPPTPTPTPMPSPSPPKSNAKPVRETYLAIPRELTTGTNDDKKIPKMLILKTPETSDKTTINLHDLSMSIAERIKTVGQRKRTKRYSGGDFDNDVDSDDDDDDNDDDDDYNEEPTPTPAKVARRTSTSSSIESSTDRYRELRDKNNEASRKSRQNRKEKEKDMMKSLEDTEKRNSQLRSRADELEQLVLTLRKILLQIVLNSQKKL